MVTLTSCRMVGCQSHEDTYMEFIPGLNVIVADNNVGKSVFMKMLKIACHPKAYKQSDRPDLIRNGFDRATVMYTFSDGSCGVVEVYPNKVVYYFTPKYKEVDFVATLEPDPKFVENLSVLVEPTEVFFGNIIDLDQALLLVSSSDKSNNNLVQMAINDSRINFLLSTFKERSEDYKKAMYELEKVIVTLEYRVEKTQYVDIDYLETKVDILESGVHVFDKLLELGRDIEYLVRERESKDYDFLIFISDFYTSSVEFLEGIGSFSRFYDEDTLEIFNLLCDSQIESLIPKNRNRDILMEVAIELFDASEVIEDIKALNPLEDVIDYVDLLQSFAEIRDSAVEISVALDGIKERDMEIKEIEEVVNSMGERVPCVIYGEVQHVNGNCIPIGNGSSLA